MKQLSKICGIFAVATMMLSTFYMTSCNSEDDFDYGPDSQYTLANRAMTRGTEYYIHGTPVKAGSSSNHTIDLGGINYTYNVNWTRGFTGMTSPVSNISISVYPGTDGIPKLPNDPYYIGSSGTWSSSATINLNFRYSELDIPEGIITDNNKTYPRVQRIVSFNLPVTTVYDSTLVAL